MFKCEICDKGFELKKRFREHQKIHKGSKLKHSQCEDFTTERAMKQHIKEQHGEKKNLKCPHCDHISHTKVTIYLHVKCCPKNPNRIPLYCELCMKVPWYTGSKLLEHKWKDHKWK